MAPNDIPSQPRLGLSVGAIQWGPTVPAESSRGPGRAGEIAHAHPRVGFLRDRALARRAGPAVNHEVVRSLYRLEGLQPGMRLRRRSHAALHHRPPPVGPS